MATTYTPITSTTVSGTSTTQVSLTSIPSTYTDLILVCYKNDNSATDSRTNVWFNSDTSTSYSETHLLGVNNTTYSGRSTNRVQLDDVAGGAKTSTGIFATSIYQIMNYANTSVYKTVIYRQGSLDSSILDYGTSLSVGLYRSLSAISSIQISGNVAPTIGAGSTFTLYGIKAA